MINDVNINDIRYSDDLLQIQKTGNRILLAMLK